MTEDAGNSSAVREKTRDERDMRVVELLVAGIALLASLFLSLPR